jgi:hypothetical protein
MHRKIRHEIVINGPSNKCSFHSSIALVSITGAVVYILNCRFLSNLEIFSLKASLSREARVCISPGVVVRTRD